MTDSPAEIAAAAVKAVTKAAETEDMTEGTGTVGDATAEIAMTRIGVHKAQDQTIRTIRDSKGINHETVGTETDETDLGAETKTSAQSQERIVGQSERTHQHPLAEAYATRTCTTKADALSETANSGTPSTYQYSAIAKPDKLSAGWNSHHLRKLFPRAIASQ